MLITLKNGQREFENGMTPLEIAGQLSQELKKQALCARVDGKIVELWQPIDHDCELEILTFEDDEAKRVLRHTASHVLAQAVKKLHPEAKLAIGPAIDNGFYYDFDVDEPFTPDFLKEVEKEMSRIVKKNDKLERFELPRQEAIQFMEEKGEPYKVELINDLPEDEELSFFKQGDYVDLCAGPHAAKSLCICIGCIIHHNGHLAVFFCNQIDQIQTCSLILTDKAKAQRSCLFYACRHPVSFCCEA